jgi:PHP family Zn ribbon phosphoesterase
MALIYLNWKGKVNRALKDLDQAKVKRRKERPPFLRCFPIADIEPISKFISKKEK